ncbi:MAG: DinB family protein [Acidobacteria bacterium]|nr:DinB family protein [Acidobacteriota bacterium]MBI3264845.1 DinB family protein [Acidobacteriota bacterium]
MHLQRILELYRYNTWANGRVLDAASRLSSEALLKDLGSSFPSVRDTLVHISGAEWVWLQRWRGSSPKALPSAWDFPTLDAVKTRWIEIERDQAAYLRTLTEEALDTEIPYINFKGQPFKYPLWQQLSHVVNHSTYHRGQVTTMVRQLGAEPVSTDLLRYYDSGGR